MFIVNENGTISSAASQEIARLRTLVADLERIEAGKLPTAEELAAAPLLDNYYGWWTTVPILAGDIHGHPHLGTTVGTTTTLWASAPKLGWARTQSRFYRLLSPAAQSTQR